MGGKNPTLVFADADIVIKLGEKVLLAGESGSGKSTLVRAIAGLWPWGEGEIAIKPNAKLFMMPQKPYIPLGTLRRAAAYPQAADTIDDDALKDALKEVGLEKTIERIDERLSRHFGGWMRGFGANSPARPVSTVTPGVEVGPK